MVAIVPMPFQTFFRMNDGQALDQALAFPTVATETALTAKASGTQSNATQLTATISRVSTVTTAADAVALPPANVGLDILVINDGVNAMQVFGNNTAKDTINGIATATGISQPAGTAWQYTCTLAGNWITKNSTQSITTLAATNKFTYTGPRVGTFVANNATNVTVANTLVTSNSMIVVTLNTPGGTVGAIPAVQSITPATSFVVKASASDTSTYNYMIIENQ